MRVLLLIFASVVVNSCGTLAASFDFLVFAQEWPGGKCVPDDNKCFIPNRVRFWTIHGLWPNNRSSESPDTCNRTWYFDPTQLQPIRAQLQLKWPNVQVGSKDEDFWKHEWRKHGTCATSLPELNTELKYFSKALALSDQFNILNYLKNANITPRKAPYKMADVRLALELVLKKTVQLNCEYDKKFTDPLLEAVYVCLDNNFSVINCPKKGCNSKNVIYRQFSSSPRPLSPGIGILICIGIFIIGQWHQPKI